MKILRTILGSVAGYLLSAVSSIVWFYSLTHHDPTLPASLAYIAASSLFGISFSLLAGFIGATIARGSERAAGQAIALLTLFFAAWSWWETPGYAHWAQAIAVVLMGPSAILGARVASYRRRQPAPTATV